MSAEPDFVEKKKANLQKYVFSPIHQGCLKLTRTSSDPSGADPKAVRPLQPQPAPTPDEMLIHPQQDDTATAILKKKKKPNSLM